MLSHTLKVTIIICIIVSPLLCLFGGTFGSYMCDSKVDYISITFQILGRRDIWVRQLPEIVSEVLEVCGIFQRGDVR